MGSLKGLVWVSGEDYREGRNISREIRRALQVAQGMMEGLVDPVVWREEVELALEVLCDAVPGGPKLAHRAIKGVEYRFLHPLEWEEPDSWTSRAVLFACGATMIAEVAHRAGRCREAVLYTSSALDKLEAVAGGPAALHKLIARSKGHRLAGPAVAVEAIRGPAIRRAALPPEAKVFLRSRTEGIVPAYLASGRLYCRTHAFSTQKLFEQLELERPEHIDMLLSVSQETRGSSMRSFATAPLVTMEYRKAQGDVAAAKRAARQALELIRDFGLYRHLEVITRYGYVSFA
jgi:hypothetical protein